MAAMSDSIKQDSGWAHEYIHGPLLAEEAWQAVGPATVTPARTTSINRGKSNASNRWAARGEAARQARKLDRPSSSHEDKSSERSSMKSNNPYLIRSASPTTTTFPHKQSEESNRGDGVRRTRSQIQHHSSSKRPLSPSINNNMGRSMSVRQPGEGSRGRRHRDPHPSTRPRATSGVAPADVIDSLDTSSGIVFHHEGPMDAVMAWRNQKSPTDAKGGSRRPPTPSQLSPVEALKESNAAAIAATPAGNLRDAIERHRPLEGVAAIPPGGRAPGGQIMPNYSEEDLHRGKGGMLARYPGVKYEKDDLNGHGEPGWTQARREREIEGLKENGKKKGKASPVEGGYEMTTRNRSASDSKRKTSVEETEVDGVADGVAAMDPFSDRIATEAGPSGSYSRGSAMGSTKIGFSDVKRSNSLGQKLRKRFGSLKRKNPPPAVQV